MSLKRKIRFSNLTISSESSSSIAHQDEASKSSSIDDPFQFPGTQGSRSSSVASETLLPSKIPRIVLKIGNQGQGKTVIPPNLLPVSNQIPVSPVPIPVEDIEAELIDTSKKPKKKKKVDEVNVQDIFRRLDEGNSQPSKSEPDNGVAASSNLAPSSQLTVLLDHTSSATPAHSKAHPTNGPFEQLLDYYLKYLQRKDFDKFFDYPITDLMAPNYSAIVKNPMDFSTMRKKLARGWYTKLPQFKHDFELICNNAMTYNEPNTIYYKAAKNLLKIGKKALSKDRLRYAKQYVPGLDLIPPELLAFEQPGPVPKPTKISTLHVECHPKTEYVADSCPTIGEVDELENGEIIPASVMQFSIGSMSGPYESIPDENAEEVLAEWRRIGKETADRLATRNTMVMIPTRLPDGTVTLHVLNPDQKSTMTVGALAGPLKSGTDHLPSFNSGPKMDATTDAFNIHVAVSFASVHSSFVYEKYYRDYGSFASTAPIYDSQGSVFTKEEIDVLRSAYGSERGVIHAESLMRWGKCVRHPFVKKSLEKFLNDASGGDHCEVVHLLNERILERAASDKANWAKETCKTGPQDLIPLSDAEQALSESLQKLKELTNEGIDVGFLDCIPEDLLKPVVPVSPELDPETLLTLNGELLHQLYLEQTKRLATASTKHLGKVPVPTETEQVLAEEAVRNLSKLLKAVPPIDIVSSVGVRRALNLV